MKTSLKQLNTRIKEIKEDKKSTEDKLNLLKIQLNKFNKTLNKLEAERKKLLSNDIVIITEHAILRYLERAKGVNISEIKKELEKNVPKIGMSGKYPKDGIKYIIKNGILVTVEKING